VPVSRVRTPLDEPLLPGAAAEEDAWVRQDVLVEALADNHLVGAAVPMRIEARFEAPMQYAQGGVVLVPRGLEYQQRYSVWSYVPRPRQRALAELPAAYPEEVGRYLEVVPDVRFPSFAEASRDEVVRALFAERAGDALLASYEPLYRQAREVVEGAATPYVAVAALEAWFRSQGGFVYDETPPPYDDELPLVTFVLDHKAGYCQHYAGAMAVMLRLLGIPARVAAGFTTGTWDDRRDEWVVTDHNAHQWVEVWFPEYGWLPFDPTPGRGQLGGSYSTSSATFGRGEDIPNLVPSLTPEALRALLAQRLQGAGLRDRRGEGSGVTAAASPSDEDGGGAWTVTLIVIAVLAGLAALVLAVKELRRRARFLSGDSRRVAASCRRELEAYLADQGVTFEPSATLEEIGAYVERRYRVNAEPFVRAAGEARFGPPGETGAAARRARRELRTLLRQLRRQMTFSRRTRGAFNYRSLTV
jgi:transglutaminase-like putative cysteine protease